MSLNLAGRGALCASLRSSKRQETMKTENVRNEVPRICSDGELLLSSCSHELHSTRRSFSMSTLVTLVKDIDLGVLAWRETTAQWTLRDEAISLQDSSIWGNLGDAYPARSDLIANSMSYPATKRSTSACSSSGRTSLNLYLCT